MSEIKSCPFCEQSPVVQYGDAKCNNENCPINGYRIPLAAWNRRADGWISTKERLPNEKGFYLCTGWSDAEVYWWEKDIRTWQAFRRGDTGWDDIRNDAVEYWMPILAAPKEKE